MRGKRNLQSHSPKGLAIWERLREARRKLPSLWSLFGQKSSSRKNYTQEWFSSLFAPEWVRHGEYLIQSDLALRDLVGIRDLGPLSADVIPLITIVHNELPRLPDFLRQYRHLGVGRFIIVDHRSNDGTSAFLKQQPDVHLYRAEGNYDRTVSGQMWVTGLARRFAMG